MDAVLACLDEIALEGLDGCPLQHLWTILEKRRPPLSIAKLDNFSKEFLWKGIVQTAEVEFYVLPNPFPHIFDVQFREKFEAELELKNPLDKIDGLDVVIHEYLPVSETEKGIRGSCASYYTRKDVTKLIKSSHGECLLTSEAAYQKWGDCLVLVASQALRERALFGPDADPYLSIFDIPYCILEHIGQARHRGRLQKLLSSQYLHLDAKVVFHHLKVLVRYGLITRQGITLLRADHKTFSSNILHIKRFYTQQYDACDRLASDVCSILSMEPSKQMVYDDLKGQFNQVGPKRFRQVEQFLQQSGYIEFETPKRRRKTVSKKKKIEGDTDSPTRVTLLKKYVCKPNTDFVTGVDEDSDEDEDRDGAINNDGDVNLVAEHPWLKQAYDLIESKGSTGISLNELGKLIQIPHLECRSLVSTLHRDKYVKPILQHCGRQRVARYVAVPHMGSSVQVLNIKKEEMKLKEMRQEVSGTPTSTPGGSPTGSPCPSPVPSVQSVDLESVFTEAERASQDNVHKGRVTLGKQVTYRKLKRRTFIVEYLRDVRIVEGIVQIHKKVVASEEEEGLSGRLDRKNLVRIVRGLENEGLIKRFKTVVQHEDLSQSIEFFLHSSVKLTEPAVQVALDQCRFRQATQSSKMKQKIKKEQEKVDREKQKQEIEKEKQERKAAKDEAASTAKSNKAEQNEKTKKLDADTSDYNKYGYLPKYGRARVLHKLVWQLVYGELSAHNNQRNLKPDGTTASMADPTTSPNKDIASEKGKRTLGEPAVEPGDRAVPISRVLDPFYLKEVEDEEYFSELPPLPMYEYSRGHFRIGDVMAVMPLSVYCKLVCCNPAILDIDEYALDPDKKNTSVCDLPHSVQKELATKTRHTQAVVDHFAVIAQMGLVTVLHPSPSNRNLTVLHLSEGATILDTTTSVTHYNEIEAQPGQPFPLRRFVFSTYAAVKSYWSDLQCIALNTPLGIVYDRSKNKPHEKSRKTIKIEEFVRAKITESNIGPPPGDGLGAAGVHKTMYIHLRRNWVRLQEPPQWKLKAATKTSDRPKLTSGRELLADGDKTNVPVNTGAESRKAGGGKEKKSRKRGKSKDKSDGDGSPAKKKKAKGKDESAPSAQKEQETTRSKMYDDEDVRALARRQSQRAIFTAEEDSLLLVCKIALTLMKKDSVSTSTSVIIRKVMHSAFESSRDKTSLSLAERIRRLVKNPQTKFNLKVVSAEYAVHEDFKDVGDPDLPFEETFHDVVHKLREKLSTSDTCSTGAVALESSLKSLHDKYTVQTLVPKKFLRSDKDVFQIGPPINSARDARKEVIRDLMQVAFTTPPEKYDAYRVFKMFDDFNTEDLDWVFKDMQKKNVINRRRDNLSFLNYYRSIPFASMTYHLSTGYYRVFLRGFTPVTVYKECSSFMKQLLKGEKHRLKDPTDDTGEDKNDSNPEEAYGKEIFKSGTPGTIVINWQETLGGHVACILALMATGKLSVETKIPDELLDMDAPEGLGEKDEKGGSPRKKACSSAQAEKGLKAKDNVTTEKQAPVTPSSQKQTKPADKNVSDIVVSSGGDSTASEPSDGISSSTKDTDAAEEKTTSTRVARVGSKEATSDPNESQKRTCSQASDAQHSNGASSTSNPSGKRSSRLIDRRGCRTLVTRERKVNRFSFPQCNLVSKFTSEHDLESVGETCSFLESKTESWRTWTRTLAVPVASLQASALEKPPSRASRTALMFKRGAADPTKSIQQLPTRAFNSHDFLFLNPCINTLKLVGTIESFAPKDSGVAMDTSTSDVGVSGSPPIGKDGNLLLGNNVNDTPGNFSGITPLSVPRDVLSLEELLDKCRSDLGYNEGDVSLAGFIHAHVLECGTIGLPWTQLQEKFMENQNAFQEATLSLDDHVILLCTSQLLFRVGVYVLRFVCHQFIKPWCLTLLKTLGTEPNAMENQEHTKSDNTAGDNMTNVKQVPALGDATAQPSLDVAMQQTSAATVNPDTDTHSVDDISEKGEKVGQCDDTQSARQMESADVTKRVGPEAVPMVTDQSCSSVQATLEGAKEVAGPSKTAAGLGAASSAVLQVKSKNRVLGKFHIICRPWVTIDGDVNEKVLKMYEEAIMTYIMENPGIAHSKVAEHFIDVIRPVSLMTILETLEQKGCITKVMRKMPAKCSLFSKPFAVEDGCPTITFYSPTVDCIVKLAATELCTFYSHLGEQND